MKNFLTSLLGTLAGLTIFAVGGILLLAGLAGAIIALGAQKARSPERLEPGSYLVFDLSTNITDAPPVFDFDSLTEDHPGTEQLRVVTRTLRAAARDPNIAGVLITGSFQPEGLGSGFGALREVREALADFKKSGKPVKAYLETASQRDYFVASVADQITLDPYGLLFMPGLAVEETFFGGAFEKYGVGIQVTRVGKYKSYVEPFTRENMSPENREETQRLLDDLWGGVLADIARSRGLTPARIQATVDAEGLIRPEAAKQTGLVDRIAYRDQVIDDLKAATGRAHSSKGPKEISLLAYARTIKGADPATRSFGNAVAVVYAEGDIVDGDGDIGEVGGTAFAKEIRQLREDDSVKAIVLRVNSPGGSASAAAAIGREIQLAKAVKPVVVSMGTYAASGGYWISADGDRIFAEPATITGSIGVFGIEPNVQKLSNDWGITFDSVKTGKFADALTISRPKTPEEMAVLQRLVDWIYAQFVAKVAEGRHLQPAYVEGIAQGRVWSGAEAKKLGLVDQLGGLNAAIGYAAAKAGLGGTRFRIEEYPRRKDLAETLSELFKRVDPDDSRAASAGLGGQVMQRLREEMALLRSFNDPQDVYARLPLDLTLR